MQSITSVEWQVIFLTALHSRNSKNSYTQIEKKFEAEGSVHLISSPTVPTAGEWNDFDKYLLVPIDNSSAINWIGGATMNQCIRQWLLWPAAFLVYQQLWNSPRGSFQLPSVLSQNQDHGSSQSKFSDLISVTQFPGMADWDSEIIFHGNYSPSL